MNHFILDAYNSYRSRLDDILLVHEILEEIPLKMGMRAVMPPFVLPYYNGVVPEDCGISGFVFLEGGHFTIHTFSYRETYFVDVVYPESFNANKLKGIIGNTFPAEKVSANLVERGKIESFPTDRQIDENQDFGPHLFLDFTKYEGPKLLDELFEIFDTMPYEIGMTPIIRPYAVKNQSSGQKVISIMTMLAESHVCLHYFEETKKAFLDIFSCKFFDSDKVAGKLKTIFAGNVNNEVLLARGSKYQIYRNVPETQQLRAKAWLR